MALQDEVVPPSQAETMVAALARNGVPHAYLAFAGEGHGFRRSETEIRCLEAELYFYGRILSFEPADELEPIEIDGSSQS
ncbi:MAG TPA: prolyl oligopeptidase family serine peptidase [Solirubrobacterales bacterium]